MTILLSKPTSFDTKPESKTLAELQQMKATNENSSNKNLIDDLPLLIPDSSPTEPASLDSVSVPLDSIQFGKYIIFIIFFKQY